MRTFRDRAALAYRQVDPEPRLVAGARLHLVDDLHDLVERLSLGWQSRKLSWREVAGPLEYPVLVLVPADHLVVGVDDRDLGAGIVSRMALMTLSPIRSIMVRSLTVPRQCSALKYRKATTETQSSATEITERYQTRARYVDNAKSDPFFSVPSEFLRASRGCLQLWLQH